MTSVLVSGGTWRHIGTGTQEGPPGDRGGGPSDVAVSQGAPRGAGTTGGRERGVQQTLPQRLQGELALLTL